MSFQKPSKVNIFVSDPGLSLNGSHNDHKHSPKISFSESSMVSNWTQQHTYTPRFIYILYLFTLVLLFDVLSPFTTDIYNGILPIIIDSNNLDSTPFMIQLSLILFTLFHSLSQILFTSLIKDCFNLRYGYIIIIGLIIYCASSVMCGLSRTIQIFIISRAAQGFGAGFAVLIQNEISSSLYPSFKAYLTNMIANMSKKSKYSYTSRVRKKRENTPFGARDHNAYSSILTNSETNYNYTNTNKDSFKLVFCLFLFGAIRVMVGIASAAPIGSIITFYSDNQWQNIFYFLTVCGLLTAVLIYPLFNDAFNLFQKEIAQQNNGLLGINTSLLSNIKASVNASHLDSHNSSHHSKQSSRDLLVDNPLEMNKNKIVISSPKSVDSPQRIMPNIAGSLHLPIATHQIIVKRGNTVENDMISTLSLQSDHTALTALSVLTNPLLIKGFNTNKINDSSINNIYTGIDSINVTFLHKFRIFSVQFLCKKPLSLLLLILFSCGYMGILLILCEISFVFEAKQQNIIETGLMIGAMVLCLIIGSVLSGYCNQNNLHCICCRNGLNPRKCQWVLSTLICGVFGIFALIALIPICKYKFDLTLLQHWDIQFMENDHKTITHKWIYISVFSYTFLFGFFVPPLMSLLYYSFIQCPVLLTSLIIHFWRNVIACVMLIIILFHRERIDKIHSNFLHFVLAMCCIAIFVIYFLCIVPMKYLSDKCGNNQKTHIGLSFNDIFQQKNEPKTSPVLFNDIKRYDVIQDTKKQHTIDLYDGNN